MLLPTMCTHCYVYNAHTHAQANMYVHVCTRADSHMHTCTAQACVRVCLLKEKRAFLF